MKIAKQRTRDILGKMSFWFHCREHTFSFNLIPKLSSYSSYFFRYDHLCTRHFSGSVILRNLPLKFQIPIALDLTGCRKCRIFEGKFLKISQKLHGGDRKHVEVCKQNLKIDR